MINLSVFTPLHRATRGSIALIVWGLALVGSQFVSAADLEKRSGFQPAAAAVDRQALQQLSQENNAQRSTASSTLATRAAQAGLQVRRQLPDGQIIGLHHFQDDMPVYIGANNTNAAISTSTDHIQPGGVAGLNLDGSGRIAGIWDGGRVRETHQEFVGRVIFGGDNAQLSNHASHVAGTMIATGVDQRAKGMAFNAQAIRSWDFFSDDNEMINQQLVADPVLVSNHSYSLISGWRYNTFNDGRWAWYGNLNTSTDEDQKFGFYNYESVTWDRLAYTSPYYVMVVSAGNDRNDFGPFPGASHWHYSGGWVLSNDTHAPDGDQGGYDSISGGTGNAKNVLTIGAVEDVFGGYSGPNSVRMSSFSGFGPTDDGRIKPDLVANGVGLFSPLAGSDTQYANYSGTSMSAPNTSGTIMLLQQHAQNLYNADLRSATIRGLLIHTADEAGDANGPDYRFGWGLLNAHSAADVLTADATATGEHEIHEEVLSNYSVKTFFIENPELSDLKVTLAWTDRQGPYLSSTLDPTNLALEHDLDLRLIDPLGGVHQPWILDPAIRTQPAATGDNFRDPVEQVLVQNAMPGIWRAEVTHKSRLVNGIEQHFSLLISGGRTVPGAGTQELYEESDIRLTAGGRIHRTVEVPQGATALRIAISGGEGDADLLVRRGARPTNNNYDCRPEDQGAGLNNSEEACVYAGPIEAGDYFIMLRSAGLTTGLNLSVTVGNTAGANTEPQARFSANQRSNSLVVDFDAGESSDSDGEITSYLWDFGDGNNGEGVEPEHTYESAGNYSVTLVVTDNNGATSNTTQSVSVETVTTGSIEALRQEGIDVATGSRVRMTVTIPPGATSVRFVQSGGSGNADLYVRRSRKPTLSAYDCRPFLAGNNEECLFNDAPGGYTYHLFVRAREAVTGTQVVVTYSMGSNDNLAPVAAFVATQSGGQDRFEFNAQSSSDADGDIENFAWDFGDGNTATGEIVSHTFASDGSYNVTLTVTDDDLASTSTNQLIEVGAGSDIALQLQWGGTGGFLLLLWEGAEGSNVFVFRDGVKIKSTGNDGRWRENNPIQNALYKVCEKLSGDCSNEVNSGAP